MPVKPPIVLASGSAVRARLMRDAGIAFEQIASGVDEAAVKARIEAAEPRPGAHGTGPQIARTLAEAKARDVSMQRPGALVVGADQVLTLGARAYDKPRDVAEARQRLSAFRGKTHVLHSGVALVRDGATLWQHYEASCLTMRAFSDEFLDAYVAAVGDGLTASVGAYQLEGVGAQLFARIEGDYFAILGLPMLPLMAELRRHGALAT